MDTTGSFHIINAWATIVQAENAMESRAFDQAAILAGQALHLCHDIRSVSNRVIIMDIYSRLCQGTAHNHPTVTELGETVRAYVLSSEAEEAIDDESLFSCDDRC